MSKSLPLAVLVGCLVGGLVYRYLLSDWFLTVAITALYSGIGYFLLAYDISLLGEHEQFTSHDKYDRLGQTIGLFGVSIGPLALIEYIDLQLPEAAGVFVWTTGLIVYLVILSAAQSRQAKST
ncbi:hypothetical protein [Haloquadratum walsbyi]|jgi:hypothetical protein|uniref:Uncharacterized protein n=1 Tax=Haloquadratum walsbyi J07HQW2 TaxID=1238425 RepID=U1MUK4_9EURY|nr:hypothetical protein [Haloquadratum walsbyi]ERG94024.1 MAG: hypothetical protein J07HQW2_00458 [Haloquadratum walsbyi J07HQW2]